MQCGRNSTTEKSVEELRELLSEEADKTRRRADEEQLLRTMDDIETDVSEE